MPSVPDGFPPPPPMQATVNTDAQTLVLVQQCNFVESFINMVPVLFLIYCVLSFRSYRRDTTGNSIENKTNKNEPVVIKTEPTSV